MPSTAPMSIEEANRTLTATGEMFEMDDVEIRGVVTRVWKNAPEGLRAILEMSRAHGDLDYLVYEDERTTFEENFAAAAALARALQDRFGVEQRGPDLYRHAQPARMGHGLLGHRGRRRRGRSPERLVDRARAPVRPP